MRRRFASGEYARILPKTKAVVLERAADRPALVATATELDDLGLQIAQIGKVSLVKVVVADTTRDELIRALGTGVESATHRVDKPEVKEAGERLAEGMLKDGYGWVSGPLGDESNRIVTLLSEAEKPQNAKDLATVGLADLPAAIAAAQAEYVQAEQAQGLTTIAGKEATRQRKQLMRRLEVKLDLYVSLVQDIPGEDPASVALRAALLAPLEKATSQAHAVETRAAGAEEKAGQAAQPGDAGQPIG